MRSLILPIVLGVALIRRRAAKKWNADDLLNAPTLAAAVTRRFVAQNVSSPIEPVCRL